jgi:ABC-2 type transport system permease protein
MKWLAITVKSGKELMRNRVALFFSLLFPVIFVLIFGAAFGSFTGGHTTYRIAVINLDEGIEINGTLVNHGENYTNVLEELRYQDDDGKNTSHIFSVRTDISPERAQRMVEDRNLVGYVVIPQNFSKAVTADAMRFVYSSILAGAQDVYLAQGTGGGDSGGSAPDGADSNDSGSEDLEALTDRLLREAQENRTALEGFIPDYDRNATASVLVQGDPARSSYFIVSQLLEEVLKGYIEFIGEATIDELSQFIPFEVDAASQEPRVVLENRAITAAVYSPFDYQVPGIIVFGLLITSITVAIFMAKEESRGTLMRLKLTEMSSFDLLLGTTIPFTILTVVQLLILIGVALLMGYNYNPDASLGLAVFVAMWGCLATVALGLILASLARDEDQAGTLGPAVVVPLSFMTSAFFPLPTVTLVDDFLGTGRPFELFDWLPWTQCSKALAKVLTFGAGPEQVMFELVMMMATTLVLFALGVWLYHTRRLRAL